MSSQSIVRRIVGPFQRFLQVEAASGIVLIAAAAVAMVWANSPWSASYASLRGSAAHTIIELSMGVFFFVVGMELRREMRDGELSSARQAVAPIATALGGMLVPAGIYAALNVGRAGSGGWGVPMATDIAFAVGVLTLLGNRVPASARILLLALAVIDDVGAVIVIAVFYAGDILLHGVVIGGVVLGLVLPPMPRLHHTLHQWVAFLVMPVFALANAGIELGHASLAGDAGFVFLGIVLGLAVGKPLGILAAYRLVGARIARATAVVGISGGIGFTMSLFIAQLAFPAGPLLDTAKLAIIVGSVIAAVVALAVGRLVLTPRADSPEYTPEPAPARSDG